MRGTLEDRYENYVNAMISMGLPYVDFDTWLGFLLCPPRLNR